ncbi:MAG: response regulator [Microscillaceae bacterium]|jgi:CheY-like chemotaxis protein|nr:response regulator [Microscillaceae bacterium]
MENLIAKQILLIDDDYINHIITKNTLAKYIAAEFAQYTSATKALIEIQGGKLPDAIIMDLNMPKMSGWQFIEELEKLNLEIPVFLLTYSIDDKDMYRSRSYALVKGYFNKPLNQKNINHIVQHLQ